MMSISDRERQALEAIGTELASSAPRLASMLVMFSRLTADERMPVREPVRSAVGGPGGPATAGRARPRRIRRCHIGRGARGWLWLAAVAALVALVVTLTPGTQANPCTHSLTTACEQTPGGFPAGVRDGAR